MRFFPAVVAAACLAAHTNSAIAGAWTQQEDHGQLIVNLWYYKTAERFTNSGQRVLQPDYEKLDLNPYIEYGITDMVTIGANLSFQSALQDTPTGYEYFNMGIGDSEFFARFRLWQNDEWVISTEPLIKLPSPGSTSGLPVIGGDDPDASLAILLGHNFTAFGRRHYADASLAYRYRFGTPENQLRFALTAGLNVADKWDVLPQLFITQRTSAPSVVSFTQSSADDYNVIKVQLSAVYHYTHDIAFQMGAFSHVDGKNAGAGEGALLSVWKGF